MRYAKACGICSLLLGLIEPAAHAASANADHWIGINKEVGRLTLYVDPASIHRDGNTGSALLLFDFIDPQLMPDGLTHYQSIETLVSVNCAANSYARIKEAIYPRSRAQGNAVKTDDLSTPENLRYETATPSTNSEAVLNYVCRAPGAAASR